MFKLIVHRIKSNFLHYFLIFIGYVAALVIISFGVNFVSLSKNNTVDQTNGEINHQRIVSINIDDSNSINYDELANILKKYSKTTSIRIDELSEEISKDGEVWSCELKPMIFNETPEWIPKITKGRYLNAEESSSKARIAVVGAGLIANELATNDSIQIDGENFNVIGITGEANDGSNYAGSIFIPLESLPDKKKKEIKTIQVCLLKNSGDPQNEMKSLIDDLNKLSHISLTEVNTSGQLSDFYMKFSVTIFVESLIILVSIGNMSILIFYLMLKTKKSILISIALGATKKIIWSQIFIELLLISVCSIIFATVFTNALIPFVKSNFTMIFNIQNLQFSNFNIIVASLVTIIMSFFISIISLRKFFKLNLVTELKGE
jgi:ABC-type antimicrobial peptide transport system permease subunit